MYVIVVYDVESKRNAKVLKLLRRYLFRVQNSVFEGELTPSQLSNMKQDINNVIKEDTNDKILIYKLLSKKNLQKETIGTQEIVGSIII